MEGLSTTPKLVHLIVSSRIPQGRNNQREPLKDLKKIYVGNLGEGSEVTQEKIKLRIAKSDRYQLVDDLKDADAMLVAL